MNRAFVRILEALRRAPGLSKAEIAERAFVSATTLSGGGYLKTLHAERKVFISGWRRNGSGGFTTPLYSLGIGPDYPRPKLVDETRAAPGMAKLLEVIEKYGPIDYRHAASLSGLSVNTVKNSSYLDALVKQGKIHICGWRRGLRGAPRAIYRSGAEALSPRPERLTPAERSRAHRSRKRAAARAASFAAQFEVPRAD